jgi:MoaA/NifB/PqqE/SkfB family radical SAM enzyme
MSKPTVQIWYELETRCNLHCKFCFNFWKDGSSKAPNKLDRSKTIKVLEVLFSLVCCEKITISGGEPLLREDLFAILRFIKAHNTPTVLTTNSTLLDRRNITKLRLSGIGTFQVPLHSICEEMHDMLSGAECWKRTLHALIMLKESGANVVVVFVATQINLPHFLDVMEVCSLLGINEIIFNRFIPSGSGIKNRQLIGVPTDNEIIAVLLEGNEKARQLGSRIHLGVPVQIPSDLRNALDRISLASCPVSTGQTRWTIDVAGNVRRCNHSGASVANLLSGDTKQWISEINAGSQTSSPEGMIQSCGILKSDLVQIQHF